MIYDFVVKDIDGSDVELSKYRGKVLLIVNVVLKCGLMIINYKEFVDVYIKYKSQDFEILVFFCNQFGGQEFGMNEQIKEFVCMRFKVEYFIFDKINVNGFQEVLFYKYLKLQKGGGWLLGDSIKWNFVKFFVDKNGNVVDCFVFIIFFLKIEKFIEIYLSRQIVSLEFVRGFGYLGCECREFCIVYIIVLFIWSVMLLVFFFCLILVFIYFGKIIDGMNKCIYVLFFLCCVIILVLSLWVCED